MRTDEAVAARLSRPIEIARVDAFHVALPLSKPMKMASAVVATSDNLIVRIESKEGHVGWGEAASTPVLTGETGPSMVAITREKFAPMLMGQDARHRAALVRKMAGAVYENNGTKSAIEIALSDLVGRTLNVPFTDLYGGALRPAVKPMWLLGNATVEEDIAEAKSKLKDEGIAFFKLKVGVKKVEDEIKCALAVRDALGPRVILCADANTGFDEETADRYLDGVADANLSFLEQPLKTKELAAVGRLAARHKVAIGSDEGIHSIADIEANAARGVRGLSLKLIKFGGPAALLQGAAVCERLGMQMNLAGKIAESSIAAIASGHMASMLPSCNWGVNLTHPYLSADVVKSPLQIVDGLFTLPVGPGLGIEVDEAAVKKLTVG